MIDFKIDNFLVHPTSVWYHSQNDQKSEGLSYEIKINDNEFIHFLENKFNINVIDKLNFISQLNKMSENHFNLISILTNYLIKNKLYKRVEIKWVLNSIKKIEYIQNELIIRGTASKYINDY